MQYLDFYKCILQAYNEAWPSQLLVPSTNKEKHNSSSTQTYRPCPDFFFHHQPLQATETPTQQNESKIIESYSLPLFVLGRFGSRFTSFFLAEPVSILHIGKAQTVLCQHVQTKEHLLGLKTMTFEKQDRVYSYVLVNMTQQKILEYIQVDVKK